MTLSLWRQALQLARSQRLVRGLSPPPPSSLRHQPALPNHAASGFAILQQGLCLQGCCWASAKQVVSQRPAVAAGDLLPIHLVQGHTMSLTPQHPSSSSGGEAEGYPTCAPSLLGGTYIAAQVFVLSAGGILRVTQPVLVPVHVPPMHCCATVRQCIRVHHQASAGMLPPALL